jgi:hypothetical protein
MTRRAIFPFVIGSVVTAALAGCQTAYRLAWWKNHDDSASSVAQSSAPELPSAGATPQAVDVPGLEPASSPSSANLAAAQTRASAPSVSMPGGSESTIANAPFAKYPLAGTTATTGSANSSLSASDTTAAASAIASVPPSGPYDPYGYKPSNPYAAATATAYEPPGGNPLRSIAPTTDRYPMPAASSTPASDSQYASAAVPASAETPTGVIDKYALPPMTAQSTPETGVNNSAAAYPAVSPAAAAFANSPIPGTSQAASAAGTSTTNTSAATAASPIEVTPATTTTVQLPPAGKYRPGGTSDYSTTESQHVEVATRPAPPQTPSASGASDAWTLPTSTAPATGGGIGTY